MVATYDYPSEDGRPHIRVRRWEPGRGPDGKPNGKAKSFTQHHQVNGRWVAGLGHARRVLNRQPEVIAAVQAGQPVFITEGEKDAETLFKLSYVANCNLMGANSWEPPYATATHKDGRIAEPKTSNSVRTVNLPKWLREEVGAACASREPADSLPPERKELLFFTREGTPLCHGSTFNRSAWRPAVVSALPTTCTLCGSTTCATLLSPSLCTRRHARVIR